VKRPSGGDIGTFGEGYSLAGGGIKVISVRRVATEVRVWHQTDMLLQSLYVRCWGMN